MTVLGMRYYFIKWTSFLNINSKTFYEWLRNDRLFINRTTDNMHFKFRASGFLNAI